MSEKLGHGPEKNQSSEHLSPHHETEPSKERHVHHEKKHNAETSKEVVESIKHKVEVEAKSGKEITVEKQPDQKQHHYVTKELKDETLKRTLQKTRKHLSKPERVLSKAIHQPAINAVSKTGEKTIARPTGIVTGAFAALIGSTYVLWSAKHYGYEYNYWVVLGLFIGGYAIGLAFELLVYGYRRLRSSR